jgi:hypothetical protein
VNVIVVIIIFVFETYKQVKYSGNCQEITFAMSHFTGEVLAFTWLLMISLAKQTM